MQNKAITLMVLFYNFWFAIPKVPTQKAIRIKINHRRDYYY